MLNTTKAQVPFIRLLAVVLSVVLVVIALPAKASVESDLASENSPKPPFIDISPDFWAYNAIAEAYNDGIFTKNSQNTFGPDEKLTAFQFEKLLQEISPDKNIPESITQSDKIPLDSNTGFIARWDVARRIANLLTDMALTFPDPEKESSQIIVKKIPDIASLDFKTQNDIGVCYSFGILSGIDAFGDFAPDEILTRAQAAIIYIRLKNLNLSSTEEIVKDDPMQNSSGLVLSNGKPITEDNIIELIEEYRNGKTPGEKARATGFESYTSDFVFDAYNPKYLCESLYLNGLECAKFAFAFWDDLFGDLPARELDDLQDVRPGDLIHRTHHWEIATTNPFEYKPVLGGLQYRILTVGGNPYGEIHWNTMPVSISDGTVAIYTRYPD